MARPKYDELAKPVAVWSKAPVCNTVDDSTLAVTGVPCQGNEAVRGHHPDTWAGKAPQESSIAPPNSEHQMRVAK